MTDEALMSRYIAGDYSAFEVLYQRHSGKIFAYLRKKLPSHEETDEVFQNSFMKFHHSRHNYNSKYPLLQWLFVIAKTSLTDHYRKNGRRVQINDIPIEDIAEVLSQNEAPVALSTLGSEQRQVVEWRYLDDLTYEEIAKKLNKSEATIRQMVSRAIKKLRGSLLGKENEV